jgi:AraC family transcriptional regulator
LLGRPDALMLSVYHDNPEVTDDSKLRTSVCLTVPDDTEVGGEVGKMEVPGGKYAIGRFEVHSDGFAAAWNTLYGTWLPESGYEPDDRPAFELYHNDPKEHPEGKCIFDVCIPVKPV